MWIILGQCFNYNSHSMRLIICSHLFLAATWGILVNRQHSRVMVAIHLKYKVNVFKLSDGRLLQKTMDFALFKYLTRWGLKWILLALQLKCPWWRNHIQFIADVIQPSLGEFRRRLSGKGRTKRSKAYDCDQHFRANTMLESRNCHRLQTEDNVRINRVSAMRPWLAMRTEKVCISKYF